MTPNEFLISNMKETLLDQLYEIMSTGNQSHIDQFMIEFKASINSLSPKIVSNEESEWIELN